MIKNVNGNYLHESLSWSGIKKIAFPYFADDENYADTGGIFISKVS